MSNTKRVLVRKVSQGRRPAPAVTDEPYAGFIDAPPGPDGRQPVIHDRANAGRRHRDLAATAPHLLVPGGTGSGKSRTVLAPNILRWAGKPVIAMSSKTDLVTMTIRKRAQHGPVYLLDLAGEVPQSALEGVPVTRVRVDPCALIETDDDALDMADLLQEISGGGGGDSDFWKNLARRRLACFLRAGGWYPDPITGKQTWGGGVAWALDASEDPGEDQSGQAADSDSDDPDSDEDQDEVGHLTDQLAEANWNAAYLRARLMGSRHAKSLLAAKRMDPRQRDSIGINCQTAINAWSKESVIGADDVAHFRPEMLTAPGATLYIVSPMIGGAGPAVSTVLVKTVDYWRKRIDEIDSGKLNSLMFVLDEFTNGTKIPAKFALAWVGEGRGLGIRLVLALQDSSQLEELWGQAAAKVMRKIMPATLILPGADEDDLLERAVKGTAPEERITASVDASGRASQSRDRLTVDISGLIPRKKGEARLLLGGAEGVRVHLPDISATDLLD